MRILTTLASLLMTLGSCGGHTRLDIGSTDGVAFSASRVSVSADSTRFHCVHSPTGTCHYLVYESSCSQASGGSAGYSCEPRSTQRFELASGQARQLQGLGASVAWCMDPASAPRLPGCSKG